MTHRLAALALLTVLAFAPVLAQGGPAAPASAALTLGQLAPGEKSLLQAKGLLGLRSPEKGGDSVVYDLSTGRDVTRADLDRLEKGGAAPSAAASKTDAKRERPVLQSLVDGPFGPLPGGEYALRPGMGVEGVAVTPPGHLQVETSLTAGNYLTREDGVVQKFENHTVRLDLRTGIDLALPTEVGVQLNVDERDEGFLNGFIESWEHGTAWLFNKPNLVNSDRSGPTALRGTADAIQLGGKTYVEPGELSPRLGDVTFLVKTALVQSSEDSWIPDVAARLALTVAAGTPFSSVSSAGVGLSAQERLTDRLFLHADAREVLPLASTDHYGLPLKSAVPGATLGLEYKLNPKTSIGAQADWQASPYRAAPFAPPPFTDQYADVTVGVSRVAELFSREFVFRLSAKEDFNPGARSANMMDSHGDTDFQVVFSGKTTF